MTELVIALSAGLLSFLSPCVLPLIPGYISYVSGSSLNELLEEKQINLFPIILFTIGFSTVFIIFGAASTFLGQIVLKNSNTLRIIAGVIIIIFSLNIIGVLNLNFLNFEKRINYSKKKFHTIKSSYQKINIDNYDRPLIVVGRINKSLNARMITKLSNHLKAPILADPLSQIRFNNKNILGLYDFYIDNLQINPDIIIRIGQKPTSKKLCDKLKEWNDHTILIDSYGRFNDDARKVVKVNEEDFIKDIIQKTKPKVSNSKFYDYLLNLEDTTTKNINNSIAVKNLNQYTVAIGLALRGLDI